MLDLDQWVSNGEQNAEAEAALERYEIEGVEFTYAKVADINTVTRKRRDQGSVQSAERTG